MAVKLNGVIFAHADGTIVVTPREGPNAAIPFELKATKSFEIDPGAGSVQLEGLTIKPIGIAPTAAKPKWSAELSAAAEGMALAKHLGPGAVTVPCDVVFNFNRPAKATVTFAVVESLITDGLGGVKSDSGSAPNSNLGGNATDILIDGVSIYTRPPA